MSWAWQDSHYLCLAVFLCLMRVGWGVQACSPTWRQTLGSHEHPWTCAMPPLRPPPQSAPAPRRYAPNRVSSLEPHICRGSVATACMSSLHAASCPQCRKVAPICCLLFSIVYGMLHLLLLYLGCICKSLQIFFCICVTACAPRRYSHLDQIGG